MRRVLAGATAALVLVLASAAPASAHAELESTDPGAGAQLERPPRRITLSFTEGVDVRSDGLHLLDADGERLDVGRAEHLDGNRSLVAAELPELTDGVYVVSWRVTSSDSHPISGAFTFTVGDGGGDPGAALAAAEDIEPGGSTATGVAFGIVRFLAFASLIILVGGAAFVVGLAPELAGDRTVCLILWSALAALAVTTVAGIGIQAAYTAGAGLGDAVDGELIGDVLGTRFGQVWLARLGLCLLAIPFLARLPALPGAAAVVGVALLATPALSGHASTGDQTAVAVVADVIHLGAGAWWLAGLALLALVVLRRVDGDTAGAIARRFSPTALVAVAVVVLTGVFQSWRQVRVFDALLNTDYGRLLMAKVAVVAVLLGAAAAARVIVRRQLLRVGSLRRVVGAEAAVGVLVIGLTAALVNAPPARSAVQEEPAGPFVGEVHTATLAIGVRVDPARVGPNIVEITIATHAGDIVDPPEVTARLSRVDDDTVGPIDVVLARAAAGRWTAEAVAIPFAGAWRMDVAVRTTDIDLERVELEIPVS